ncbi:MAG: ATP synthase subunit I [Bacillota bacterium]
MLGQPVPELDNQLRYVLRFSGYLLVGICITLFIYPGDSMLWGLAVGTVTGIYNSVVLARRIKRLPDLSPGAARKHMNRGLAIRLTMIMAVLFFVSQRLPFVNLFGVGAGILIPSCISIVVSVADTYRMNKQSEAFLKKYYGK